jgi:hypothetical protein
MSNERVLPPDGRASPLARWNNTPTVFVLMLALLAGLFWTVVYLQFTVDDAYISFRYAKELVTNHVWNWNPSGPHVEAYTSATYTVLAVLPTLLHIPVAVFFKLFGAVCIGAMLYRLYTQALGRFAWVLGFLLAGLDPWVWAQAYAGLETPLYMLLILEMGICVKNAAEETSPYIYVVALLLPLTRPEGIVFSAVGLVLFWHLRREAPRHWPALWVCVLLGGAYFIARWQYFHHLLPNPFYVKVAHSSLTILRTNVQASKGYLLTLLLIALLAKRMETRVFAVAALLVMLLLFEPRHMPMNYADRYYFQLTLPAVLFFLIAEDAGRAARLAGFVCVLFLTAIDSWSLRDPMTYFPYLNASHVSLGKRLAPFAKGHTLLIGDAGAVPYFSNWFSYDYLGLCTNDVAAHGVSQAYLQQIHPDLIVVYGSAPGPDVDASMFGPDPGQDAVMEYIHRSGDYEYAGASKWRDFYLVEFLKKSTPDHDAILKALEENTASSSAMTFSIQQLLHQQYVPWHE